MLCLFWFDPVTPWLIVFAIADEPLWVLDANTSFHSLACGVVLCSQDYKGPLS